MRQCLSERRLLECYSGDGPSADHAHLRGCADCADRFDRLRDDLDALGRVLEGPPPAVVRRSFRASFGLGWAAAVVAAALLGVIIIGRSQSRQPARPQLTAAQVDVSGFSRDLSAALFASGEAEARPTDADVAYLQAALGDEWPCTREQMLNGECDGPVYALVADEE